MAQKSVVITGISSGIGFGLAKEFLNQNYQVFGLSRRRPGEFDHTPLFNFIELDISDFKAIPPAIEGLLNPVKQENADIDLVILNAGVLSQVADMKDTSLESTKSVMDVNVWANKLILDEILKYRVKQVVAISSGASVSGSRGWNAYSLSKATLNMLIMLYAAENETVHFSSIAPGLVDTAMQEYISQLEDDQRFSIVSRLKSARGTEQMPSAEQAATMLIESFAKVLSMPSGSFADVRKM